MAKQSSELAILGLSKKKAGLTALGTILLAGAAVGLLGKAADFHRLFQAITTAGWGWFLACLAGELIAYQGYIFAYRDFARAGHGPKLNWWQTTRIVGIGMGAVIFGATAASLAVDYWSLRKAGAKPHEAARRVLGINTMEWAVLSAAALVAACLLLSGLSRGAPLWLTLIWIIIVPLCYIGAVWFTAPGRVKRFTALRQFPAPSLNWSPASWPYWLSVNMRKGLADAIGGVVIVRHIIGHPLKYKTGNLGFIIYWLGHLICLFGAVRAFGYHIGPAALVLAYATTYLLTIAPLPAGGAGGIEATLTYVLNQVGVPFATAVASMVAFRIFTFWLPILPTAGFLMTIKSLNEDLPKVARDKKTDLIHGFSG